MKLIKLYSAFILTMFFCTSVFAENDELAFVNLSSYKLGAGDKISIRIFGEPDLSVSGIILSESGSFMFPSVGEMSVIDKNISEVEHIITEKLKGKILVDPRVYVSLDEYRPFFISGAVNKSGNFPYQPGLTITKAAAIAGGFTDKANLKLIYVDQADGTKKLVTETYSVKPGDNILIKEFEPIYVNGMVRDNGGSYPYPKDGINVRKAISLAGGFHERANVKKIFIVKNKDPKQLPILADLNTAVEPGDTITVEESFF